MSPSHRRTRSNDHDGAPEHRSFRLTTQAPPELAHVSFESHQVDGRTVVVVHGNLDTVGAAEFVEYCSTDVTPDRPVGIDLADLDFIDSAGLSALLQTINGLRAAGTAASVVRASGQALGLFDLTGLREPLMDEQGALPGW